ATPSRPPARAVGITTTRWPSPAPCTVRAAENHFMENRRSLMASKKKKPAKKKSAPKKKAPAKKKTTAKSAKLLPAAKKQLGKRPAFNAKLDSANDPAWVAPVWADDVLLGAHVSVAGGSHEAPRRARAIGATAMQLFTKMANRWAERV